MGWRRADDRAFGLSRCLVWSMWCGALLSRGSLAFCPVRCTCNNEQLVVVCEKAGLDVVPITLNPELKELILAHNHIKGITLSFGVYGSLRYLDMSHNQLDVVAEDNFKEQKHLKFLLLNNNVISTLQNDSFKGLQNLQVLHLNENLLEDLPSHIFIHLYKLEKLDLSRNRLPSLSSEALAGLDNLKTLLLRGNRLTSIPSSDVFHQVPSLLNLDLGHNSLHYIPEGAFEALDSLQELSLDGCGLQDIPAGALKSLSTLRVLRVQDNGLEQVPTEALVDVEHLEEFVLGQNSFYEIKSKAFRGLNYLRTVIVDGAKSLTAVRSGAFADNSNLEKVVFNHNPELRVIEPGTFEGLANVRVVNLRGNAFHYLDLNLLPWDELEYLDVRDNPLVCNCSVLWLWHLIHRKNLSASEESDGDATRIICAEPPSLSDRLLADIPVDTLDCGSEDSRKQILLGVFVGLSVLLIALGMLAFKFRTKVADVLKTKWNGNRKEPQYQKTAGIEDDTNILQVAGNLPLKSTPVTEL